MLLKYGYSENRVNALQKSPFKVHRVSGACLMIRKEAVNRIGLLDERFFFYAEDVDWCHRANLSGWGVYCIPSARIVHFGGKSSEGKSENTLEVEYYKSRYKFFEKYYERRKVLIWRAVTATFVVFRLLKAVAAYVCRFNNAIKRKAHGKCIVQYVNLTKYLITARRSATRSLEYRLTNVRQKCLKPGNY